MIRIGRGFPLLRLRLGQAWLVVRGVPSTGKVSVLLQAGMPRRVQLHYILGGVAGNGTILAAAGLWFALDPGSIGWTLPVVLAQVLGIGAAAFPRSWTARDGPHVTDGERLRRHLRGEPVWPADDLPGRMARLLGVTPALPPPSPALPEIAYQITRPERLREAWARRDMGCVLRGLLAKGGLSRLERSLALNELVLREALCGDGFVTQAELETWSMALVSEVGTPEVHVTRAGALICLGRLDEAEAMLGPWGVTGGVLPRHHGVVAAHLRVARARAELAALREG